MAAAIGEYLKVSEMYNVDVALFLISNKVLKEEFLNDIMKSINDLSLSNSLMITVGVICVNAGSDEIYDNLDAAS